MIKTKATKNMFLAYETNLKEFREHIIKVGLPESVGGAQHSDSGLTVAQLGAVHEFGVPEKGIPKRSFIREPIINEQKKINNFIKTRFSEVANNSMTSKTALAQIGQLGMDICKKAFRKNDWEANSKKTVELKGSSRPLIDSGQLSQSITYVVEKA